VSTEKPLTSINQSPIARSSTSVGQPVTSTEHQGFQQYSSIKSEETGFQPSKMIKKTLYIRLIKKQHCIRPIKKHYT
jgi:hypothetical protein